MSLKLQTEQLSFCLLQIEPPSKTDFAQRILMPQKKKSLPAAALACR